jgi:hypothetical protein
MRDSPLESAGGVLLTILGTRFHFEFLSRFSQFSPSGATVCTHPFTNENVISIELKRERAGREREILYALHHD